MAIERLVIRRLYHRPVDSIVATWGISLIATQGVLIFLGSTMQGIGTPFGSVSVGGYSYSIYRLVLFAVGDRPPARALSALLPHPLRHRLARDDPAAAHGPRPRASTPGGSTRLTFGLGAALAGLAGGLYAPTMTMVPTLGRTFIVESFVTVVTGGADIFVGAAPAAAILAAIKAALTAWHGQLFGQIGLLVAVIIVIRLLPGGLSGWLKRS